MRDVKIALVAGLALLVIAVGLALLHSPMSVAGTNRTPSNSEVSIASTTRGASYCQAGETLPQRTSAIRISLGASIGPRVRVLVSSGGRPITSGEQGSAWTGAVVTIPVKPLPRTVSDVTVCVSFRLRHETLDLAGKPTPNTIAAHDGPRALAGRMWIQYLRPGTRSWASLVPSIMHHMGLGRATGGPGIVLLAFALFVAVAALASKLLVKELR